jgi:hypothetical protein
MREASLHAYIRQNGEIVGTDMAQGQVSDDRTQFVTQSSGYLPNAPYEPGDIWLIIPNPATEIPNVAVTNRVIDTEANTETYTLTLPNP